MRSALIRLNRSLVGKQSCRILGECYEVAYLEQDCWVPVLVKYRKDSELVVSMGCGATKDTS